MYSGGKKLRNVRAQRAIRAFRRLGYETREFLPAPNEVLGGLY